MYREPQRSRLRILVIGALVGSALSVGVATGDVSARAVVDEDAKIEVKVDVVPSFDWPVSPSPLRSGIRW